MLADLPQEFCRGGQIVRRQTTFWDVQTVDRATFRVHFDGKAEFSFVGQIFDGAELTSSHPLLTEYKSPSDNLYVGSSVGDAEAVLTELRSAAATHFASWRPLERYLNDQSSAERVLRAGYGLLLSGPREFVIDAAAICSRHELKVSILAGVRDPVPVSALTLGRNFVIAHAFRFEPLAQSTA